MERAFMGGVVAGVLLLAGTALPASSAPSTAQAVDRPTVTAVDFSPEPVVIDSTAGESLSGTVTISEPEGWTFKTATVLDNYCAAYQWRPTCPRWLTLHGTTKAGDVRTVSLAGTIPNRSAFNGALVSDERWGLPMWLVYADPTGAEHVLTPGTGVLVLRGMRVGISAPDGVGRDDPATIAGAVEVFEDSWVVWAPAPPYDDAPYSIMTLQGSAAGGGWESIATGPLDQGGKVTFHLSSVTETRDYRLEYMWFDPAGTRPRRVVDSAAHRIEVREGVPPGPPSVALSRAAGGDCTDPHTMLRMDWSPPADAGSSPVTGYRFFASGPGRFSPEWISRVLTPQEAAELRPFVFTDMEPGTTYTVGGNHRAWLRWQPPASDGGVPVDRYQVGRGALTRSLPVDRLSFLFRRLENGRRYHLAVRAHNRIGWGPWSPAVVVRPHR